MDLEAYLMVAFLSFFMYVIAFAFIWGGESADIGDGVNSAFVAAIAAILWPIAVIIMAGAIIWVLIIRFRGWIWRIRRE